MTSIVLTKTGFYAAQARLCVACPRRCPLWAVESRRDEPRCPLGRLPGFAKWWAAREEIAAKAWPPGVDHVSGCCDNPINYPGEDSTGGR